MHTKKNRSVSSIYPGVPRMCYLSMNHAMHGERLAGLFRVQASDRQCKSKLFPGSLDHYSALGTVHSSASAESVRCKMGEVDSMAPYYTTHA